MIYSVEHPSFPILILHLHIFFSFLLKNFCWLCFIFFFFVLGLDYCEQVLSGFCEQGPLFTVVHGLIAVASPIAEHRL